MISYSDSNFFSENSYDRYIQALNVEQKSKW